MVDLLFEFLKPIILIFINFMVFALFGKHLLWGFLATFVFMFIYLSMDNKNLKKQLIYHNTVNMSSHGHGHGHGYINVNENKYSKNRLFENKLSNNKSK